jgi:hypothetical protein
MFLFSGTGSRLSPASEYIVRENQCRSFCKNEENEFKSQTQEFKFKSWILFRMSETWKVLKTVQVYYAPAARMEAAARSEGRMTDARTTADSRKCPPKL